MKSVILSVIAMFAMACSTACGGATPAPAKPVPEQAPWVTASSEENSLMKQYQCLEVTELMKQVLSWPAGESVPFPIEGSAVPLVATPHTAATGEEKGETVLVVGRASDKVTVIGLYPADAPAIGFVDYFFLRNQLMAPETSDPTAADKRFDESLKLATGKYFCVDQL